MWPSWLRWLTAEGTRVPGLGGKGLAARVGERLVSSRAAGLCGKVPHGNGQRQEAGGPPQQSCLVCAHRDAQAGFAPESDLPSFGGKRKNVIKDRLGRFNLTYNVSYFLHTTFTPIKYF